MRQILIAILISSLANSSPLFAQESSTSSDINLSSNLFAEQFYMRPDQKAKYKTSEVDGFMIIETPSREHDTRYSVVTDFGPNIVKMRYMSGVNDIQQAKKWLQEHSKTATYKGVEIRRLEVSQSDESTKRVYWIGHKSFPSAQSAYEQIEMSRSLVEAQGLNFDQQVIEAQTLALPPETEPPLEIKSPAQFQKEEEMFLKYLDWVQAGTKLYGPFQGQPAGEPLIWQSFGESTWRLTNVETKHYDSQVGFWTNRVVFKGIRAPLNTIDPYIEAVLAMDSNGIDFKDTMKLFAGLEWRPLARNPWLSNYQPGGIPILEWIKNYRFYVQYGDRKNLKDEILGSTNHDLLWGVSIFYEFGVELPPLDQPPPVTFTDYLREYVWGEYFGDYRVEMTNFGPEDDFDGVIANSSIILGVKLPGIPLPSNPINEEFVLMPYMRFEHVNNDEFSFYYQNRYFIAAGVRWMPFRNWRHKENEWLSKFKVFGEFVGVGGVFYGKEDPPPEVPEYDWRVGLSFSSRRF